MPCRLSLPFLGVLLQLCNFSFAAADPVQPMLREGDILTWPADSPQRRGVAYPRHALWPDGIMPVWIAPSIDTVGRATVLEAIAIWNAAAGVRIDVLDREPASGTDHVRFEPGTGCASWVGRRGGAQSLWIAPACNRGSVLHELGHALGLEHEHTRSDRDAWIRIHWDNIAPDKRHNFDVAPDDNRLLGDYDYDSIMHYGPSFFGIDGATTIEPLDPSATIGQRKTPSDGDIAALGVLYGTDLSLHAEAFDEGTDGTVGGRRIAVDTAVTNQGENGAHDVRIDVRLPADWRLDGVFDPDDRWRCAEEGESVVCRRDRLAGGTVARLSLALLGPTETRQTGETTASEGPGEADEPDERFDRLVHVAKWQDPAMGEPNDERLPAVALELSSGVHDAQPDNDSLRLDRLADEPSDLRAGSDMPSTGAARADDGLPAWPSNAVTGGGAGAAGLALLGLAGTLLYRRRRY